MNDPSSRPKFILLLDSDSLMSTVLREVLESAGYVVVSAGDLGTAVDRLLELPPDLLIISPYINSMSGRMAADYLRSKCPGLPVLMVGGFIDDNRISDPNEIHAIHTFPKPFKPRDLLAEVRKILMKTR